MTPQLRFPEFTDEWQVRKLGNIGPVAMCKRILKDETTSAGDVPFYKIGTFGRAADAFINKTTFQKYKNKYSFPKKGDILISAAGTVGRLVVYDGLPAYFQDSNIVWIANDESKVSNRFLFWCYVNTNWRTEDTTIARLYNDNLRSISIKAPSKPEQEKIADFLTAVDERIGVSEKKLELLEAYKRGVMKKIFNQQIRFKDENGEDYPDWEEKKLGELGETYNGLTGKSGDDFGIGANFITYMQIFSDSRISQNFGKVRINPGEKQNTVEYGDIFFTTSSETPEETGYTSVLLNNPSDTYLNSFCFGYRADKNILSPEFARYLFHSSNVRSSIVRLAQGSTRYNISKIQLMKMKLAIPSFEEQQKIATFLTALDDKITAEKSKLTATRKFKKALLQKMFV